MHFSESLSPKRGQATEVAKPAAMARRSQHSIGCRKLQPSILLSRLLMIPMQTFRSTRKPRLGRGGTTGEVGLLAPSEKTDTKVPAAPEVDAAAGASSLLQRESGGPNHDWHIEQHYDTAERFNQWHASKKQKQCLMPMLNVNQC